METIQCKNCGGIMNRKTGVKNGKPWAGYFCQNRECKAVEWENSKPAFQPKAYTAKSQQSRESFVDNGKGQAKGAAFNKSVDVVIAGYNKGEINFEDIPDFVLKVFGKFKEINLSE